MYLEIRIEMDNAAFEDMPEVGIRPSEAERLLRSVGVRISQGETSGKIQDINGNSCGHFEIKED